MIASIVKIALSEDLPNGDKTTDPLDCHSKTGSAKLIAKQDLVLSGSIYFEEVFRQLGGLVRVQWIFKDGARIKNRKTIAVLEGPLDDLLKGERTALNFLGHLSGIATLTSQYVAQTKGTKCKINETRKTIPGMREAQKRAVIDGGGTNHRQNLSDKVLIKENHIAAVGGISDAIARIRHQFPNEPLEVEVRNQKELKEALDSGAERVLLDNMTNPMIKQAVKIIKGRCLIEASGNMTLDRIRIVAKLGVDFISVGKLTHSAPVADMSLMFNHLKK